MPAYCCSRHRGCRSSWAAADAPARRIASRARARHVLSETTPQAAVQAACDHARAVAWLAICMDATAAAGSAGRCARRLAHCCMLCECVPCGGLCSVSGGQRAACIDCMQLSMRRAPQEWVSHQRSAAQAAAAEHVLTAGKAWACMQLLARLYCMYKGTSCCLKGIAHQYYSTLVRLHRTTIRSDHASTFKQKDRKLKPPLSL